MKGTVTNFANEQSASDSGAYATLAERIVQDANIANHLTISEFATRGPGGVADEFIELYNPTSSAVNITGWKIYYYATAWNVLNGFSAGFPAGSSVPAYGFYLCANVYPGSGYVVPGSGPTPDFTASNSGWFTDFLAGAPRAFRLQDGSANVIDTVGAEGNGNTAFAQAEGGLTAPAPSPGGAGESARSTERKSGPIHNDSMGNGYDTNNNWNDFYRRANRQPQNTASALEYPFTCDMEIYENIASIPSADNQILQLRYELANANDTFNVQVWNGSGWNTRGSTLNSTSWADWSYTLSGSEVISGTVQVRFVDVNASSAPQDSILIDYLRVRSEAKSQYTLTMAANFGTTTPSIGAHTYDEGTVVSITANAPTPNPGEQYVWNGWTGTGNGSYTGFDNPASVTMSSVITETASWIYRICGVDVTIENQLLEGLPSEVLAYTIVVHNSGNVADNIILSYIPDGWPDISFVDPIIANIAPSEYRQTTLLVHVPDGAQPCTYKQIEVIAESQFCGAQASDTAQAHVTETPSVCGVDVTIENALLEGYPSQWLEYMVKVQNTGNVTDNFNLSYVPDGWPDIYFDNAIMHNIVPGENAYTPLLVHVPDGAQPCTYKQIEVIAESQFCGAQASDTAQAHVTEQPVCGVEVIIENKFLEGLPSQTLVYTIDVHNSGNIVDNINLSYIPDGWPDISIVPQVLINVAPCEHRQATMLVHVPDGAIGCTYKYITVVAESQFCGATDNDTTEAHVTETPPSPGDWPMFHHDLQHSGYTTDVGPTNNTLRWSYTTGKSVYSSPAVAGDRVYVGSWDNKVYCLNADNGSLIWSYTTGNQVESSPAVAGDRVYVGSDDDKVYCLNADNGSLIWSYTTGDVVFSCPAVSGGKVYVGSYDHKVYCLNADNGSLIWSYTTGTVVNSSPAVENSRVYIGSWDKNVYCLNADDGSLIWSYTTSLMVESSPAVSNGKVYVGSYENVYCLNANNGSLIWNYTTGAHVNSSPAVSNGRVYFGCYDMRFYCINADNGSLIWVYVNPSVFSSPAVSNGRVYVGSTSDYKVYCFGPAQVVCGVEVTIENKFQEAMPSGILAYLIDVHNSGNIVDNIALTAVDGQWPTNDIWISPPTLQNVPPCAVWQAHLYVHIPEGTPASTYKDITVVAESQFCGATDNDTATVHVLEAPQCGVDVTIENKLLEGPPGTVLTYTIDVHNSGDVTDTYLLSHMTDLPSWTITIVPSILNSVVPCEHRQATMYVTVPENALPSTYKNIWVTAESEFCHAQDNDNATAHVTEAPSCGVEVVIENKLLEGYPSQMLAYTIDVHNSGNIVDNIFLSYIPDGWPDITIIPPVLINVLPCEHRQATILVHVPDGAQPCTYKQIIVVSESQFCGATDNDNALAHVIAAPAPCTGTASIRLATSQITSPFVYGIYKALVTANLTINNGDNLHLIFLAYDNHTVESDRVIWSRTTPGTQMVNLTNLIVPHDNALVGLGHPNDYVKRVKLVLTNSDGSVVLDNMAWFKVVQDDWGDRINWIVLNWSLNNPSNQDKMGDEINTMVLSWALTPFGPRDQHDFSQP